MSSEDDRVEALESRVADLEATVNGLTKELVDATERVRELEAELGMTPEQRSDLPAGDDAESEQSETDDTAKGTGDEGGSEPEDADAGDDIIVA